MQGRAIQALCVLNKDQLREEKQKTCSPLPCASLHEKPWLPLWLPCGFCLSVGSARAPGATSASASPAPPAMSWPLPLGHICCPNHTGGLQLHRTMCRYLEAPEGAKSIQMLIRRAVKVVKVLTKRLPQIVFIIEKSQVFGCLFFFFFNVFLSYFYSKDIC